MLSAVFFTGGIALFLVALYVGATLGQWYQVGLIFACIIALMWLTCGVMTLAMMLAAKLFIWLNNLGESFLRKIAS